MGGVEAVEGEVAEAAASIRAAAVEAASAAEPYSADVVETVAAAAASVEVLADEIMEWVGEDAGAAFGAVTRPYRVGEEEEEAAEAEAAVDEEEEDFGVFDVNVAEESTAYDDGEAARREVARVIDALLLVGEVSIASASETISSLPIDAPLERLSSSIEELEGQGLAAGGLLERPLAAAAEGLQAAQQQRKERGWTLLRAFRPEEKAKERRALQARKVILDTVQKAVDRK